jgi:hypothetical protein
MSMTTPDPQTDDEELPPFPEKPDCCFGGCAVCVLDGYEDEVRAWEQQVDAIKRRRAAGNDAEKT